MNGWVDDPGGIPEWLALLPKIKDLSSEKEYRPITCLNTSYKMLTKLPGRFMREHADRNGIWDEGQLGASEAVIGRMDQLLIDNCIMDEAREYKRDLTVAFNDYRKAYDKIHHDWMMMVYEWMGINTSVIRVLKKLMGSWKTRFELNIGGTKTKSRWIRIKCGFLPGWILFDRGSCHDASEGHLRV